jgi:hypothetical protein
MIGKEHGATELYRIRALYNFFSVNNFSQPTHKQDTTCSSSDFKILGESSSANLAGVPILASYPPYALSLEDDLLLHA